MKTPENRQGLYDYEKCDNLAGVERMLEDLNRRGWALISVTPYYNGSFLVFFCRSSYG